MAQYFVLRETWAHAVGTAGPWLHPVASVIEFDGRPGVGLFPLDHAARVARWGVIETRNANQRALDDLEIRRARAGLTRSVQAKLDAAIAEWDAWRAEVSAAEAAGRTRARR
jgi:hypothetical protein